MLKVTICFIYKSSISTISSSLGLFDSSAISLSLNDGSTSYVSSSDKESMYISFNSSSLSEFNIFYIWGIDSFKFSLVFNVKILLIFFLNKAFVDIEILVIIGRGMYSSLEIGWVIKFWFLLN